MQPLEPKKTTLTPKVTELDQLRKNIEDIHAMLGDILLSKHKDYGPLNIAHAPGGALNGLRVRMHDKLARINNLVDKGDTPKHESLLDSFIDLANYAIIAILVQRGQWEGTTTKVTNGSTNPEKSTDPLRSTSTIPRYTKRQFDYPTNPPGKA